MALDFPNSPPPVVGQVYLGSNGIAYVWDGVKWVSQIQNVATPITLNQLKNGVYTVTLDVTGNLVIPDSGDVVRDGVSIFHEVDQVNQALSVISNADISQFANISTLFANAAAQQQQLDSLVTVGNIVPNTDNETFWFNTDDGRLYIKESDIWIDANPSTVPAPEYIYTQLENVAGDIVPDEPNTYSLGSEISPWKDLWVSNATIYLNSVPLSLDETGNLTIDSKPIVTFVDGNLNVGGTVISGVGTGTAWDQTNPDLNGCPSHVELTDTRFMAFLPNSHIDLSNTGYWSLGSNHRGTGIFGVSEDEGPGDTFIYANYGNVVVRTSDNYSSNFWTFGSGGALSLPLNSKLNAGGVGVTNSAEFGTEIVVDGSTIVDSQIYMGAGTAESRAMVDGNGHSLI